MFIMFNVLKYYGFVEISTLFLTIPLLRLLCQFIGFLQALKIGKLLYCRSRVEVLQILHNFI